MLKLNYVPHLAPTSILKYVIVLAKTQTTVYKTDGRRMGNDATKQKVVLFSSAKQDNKGGLGDNHMGVHTS